jgi:hypothetical protein
MTKQMIKAALFTPTPSGMGLPIALIGSPATVKTSMVEEVCAEWGLPCQTLSPGESGEGAFGVVPVPEKTKSGLVLRYPAPEWVERVGSRGVVFIDELNTAAPAYQPALLGLMLARRIGGHYLGRNVRMLAALNPPDSNRGVWELSAALANRMVHVDWVAPGGDAWDDWLMALGVDAPVYNPQSAEAEEQRVRDAWPAASARAKQLVVGFRHSRPDLLHVEPAMSDPNSGKAWPSRRSWTIAMCSLAGAAMHGLNMFERSTLIKGCVGEKAAIEFLAWESKQDLPDPVAVLDGLAWKHDPNRLDITLAVLSGCVAVVLGEPPESVTRARRINALWEVLASVAEDGSAHDLCVPAIRKLSKAKATPRSANGVSSIASKTIAKLKPALEAAGLI